MLFVVVNVCLMRVDECDEAESKYTQSFESSKHLKMQKKREKVYTDR